MPSYGHVDQLPRALESLLVNQTRPPDEVLVIDDCSDDGSWELVQELTYQHANLRAVRNGANQGALLSARRGFHLSQGDLVLFASADDRWYSRFLEASLKAWESCSESPAISHTWAELFRRDPGDVRRAPLPDVKGGYYSPDQLAEISLSYCGWFHGHTTLISRDAYEDAGGLLPELHLAADWFLGVVAAHRWGALLVPEVLVGIRHHPDSYARTRSLATLQDVQNQLSELERSREYQDLAPFIERYRRFYAVG